LSNKLALVNLPVAFHSITCTTSREHSFWLSGLIQAVVVANANCYFRQTVSLRRSSC